MDQSVRHAIGYFSVADNLQVRAANSRDLGRKNLRRQNANPP
jgi:hypothetical protein